MSHSRSNNGIGIKIIIFTVGLVVIVSLVIWSVIQIRTPTLWVSNISLNPTTINVNGNATLSFTIKNNDASNRHDIKVTFNVTSVTFYINGVPLNKDVNLVQYYNIELQSSQESTYRFGVTAILTGGATTSTYPIRLNFYDENGTRFDTETASLTVTSS